MDIMIEIIKARCTISFKSPVTILATTITLNTFFHLIDERFKKSLIATINASSYISI